jgi:hypothetical protein
MITKTKMWKKIIQELKQADRSKKKLQKIMDLIKETPQDENKNRGA